MHHPQEAACLGDRVFVFSGSPGRITHELNIEMERPRDFNDPKVIQFATQLMDRLKQNNKDQANA